MTFSPPSRNVGSPTLLRMTSELGACTIVCSMSLLLPVLTNGSLVEVTVTGLFTSASVSSMAALIVILTVMISVGAMSFVTSQVTKPAAWLHVASADAADLNTDPAGNVSTTTTSSAVCKPMLSTVI